MSPRSRHTRARRHDARRRQPPPQTTYSLAVHADYACRSSGVCCSTPDWNITVDGERRDALRERIASGELRVGGEDASRPHLVPVEKKTREAAAEVGRDQRGRCLFFEHESGNLCAIHRQVGVDLLPDVCRYFPRMCVLQPRGTLVTLTHFCPTAAETLFRDDADLAIVKDPPAFPSAGYYRGLDVRLSKPPPLRPGVGLTWSLFERWERYAVEFLARDDYTYPTALVVLVTVAEKLRSWQEKSAPTASYFDEVLGETWAADAQQLQAQVGKLPSGLDAGRDIYGKILSCVSNSPSLDAVRGDYDRFSNDGGLWNTRRWGLVAPAWDEFEPAVRRYLVARTFANVYAYQGEGLRTAVFSVACALAALRVHAILLCARDDKPLDRHRLKEAFGLTDFLLFHAGPREHFTGFFAQAEQLPLGALIQAIPR